MSHNSFLSSFIQNTSPFAVLTCLGLCFRSDSLALRCFIRVARSKQNPKALHFCSLRMSLSLVRPDAGKDTPIKQ